MVSKAIKNSKGTASKSTRMNAIQDERQHEHLDTKYQIKQDVSSSGDNMEMSRQNLMKSMTSTEATRQQIAEIQAAFSGNNVEISRRNLMNSLMTATVKSDARKQIEWMGKTRSSSAMSRNRRDSLTLYVYGLGLDDVTARRDSLAPYGPGLDISIRRDSLTPYP
jgi:hypothetical protein